MSLSPENLLAVISDEDEEDHGNNNEDKENIQTTNMLTDPGLTDTDLTSLTAGANHPKEKDDVRQDMSPKGYHVLDFLFYFLKEEAFILYQV